MSNTPTFSVTIHPIINIKKLLIGPGTTLKNKPRTLSGAEKVARDNLQGSLWETPSEVAHIVGPDHDAYHFMGTRFGVNSTWLALVRHKGGELTVVEAEAKEET